MLPERVGARSMTGHAGGVLSYVELTAAPRVSDGDAAARNLPALVSIVLTGLPIITRIVQCSLGICSGIACRRLRFAQILFQSALGFSDWIAGDLARGFLDFARGFFDASLNLMFVHK